MEYRDLYDLITSLQYGTNLHISILFLDNFGNKKCFLPKAQTIHSTKICLQFKILGKNGFKRCFACRNLAIKKALTEKKPFGGLCINGIYEYLHPVVINDNVVCIIFVGNILDTEKGYMKIKEKIGKDLFFIDSMEKNFTYEKCNVFGDIIESYIKILFEKYSSDDDDSLINNLKNYINANIEFDFDISKTADFFHYNKQYLGRLFKSKTGLNIREYINKKRLENATKLLLTTDYSIIDISYRVGFNNVTYFNRLFKKTYGTTPIEYRVGLKKQKYSQ